MSELAFKKSSTWARWSWVPGILVFAAAAGVNLALGARSDYQGFRYLWQHLSPDALREDFFASIGALHIQPPGFNVLLAGVDSFGGASELVWTVLGLAFGGATIALAADATRRLSSSPLAGLIVGLLLALLPSTFLYAIWPSYTALVALLITLAAWSLIVALRSPNHSSASLGYLVLSGGAVTLLFLVRASYAWPLVLAWLIVLAWEARRLASARWARVGIALGILALLVVAVQVRAFTVFGTWTMTSWSGQNLLNAALTSQATSRQAIEQAATSPCHQFLLDRSPFTPFAPAQVPESTTTGCTLVDYRPSADAPAALGVDRWPVGQYNFNNEAELAWAPHWNSLALKTLASDPLTIARVITGSADTRGSFAVLLSRSDTYNQVRGNWETSGAFLGKLWPLSVAWAPVVLATTYIGGLTLLAIPALRRRVPRGYWILVGSATTVLLVNLIAEYGENQRFRVELDPLFAILAAATLTVLASPLAQRSQAPVSEPDSSPV